METMIRVQVYVKKKRNRNIGEECYIKKNAFVKKGLR